MNWKLYLVLIIAIFPVGSNGQQRLQESVFNRYDTNGDQIVDARELPDAATRARFDRNEDGKVTLAEFRKTAGIPEPSTEEQEETEPSSLALDRFDSFVSGIDTDGDGMISREEAAGGGWFDRVDRDGDGTIGSAELDRIRGLVRRFGDRILPGEVAEAPVMDRSEVEKVTSGPEILKPGEVGIGRMIPDHSFKDLEEVERSLSSLVGENGLIVAMTSATCPVSKRFLPDLIRFAEEFEKEGIPMLLVNAFSSEEESEIREQVGDYEFSVPYLHDRDRALSKILQATTTTEVFLLDAKRTLLYRGALNDQYGIDYSVENPRYEYLRDAVAAHLRGERPEVAATAAPGCEIDLGNSGESGTPVMVTYHRDVSRILQANCVRCHHEEGIAPFALDDYDEVTDRARVIRRVVEEGTMPPWFAAPPEGGGPSPWLNDHSLSEREKKDLIAWLESSEKPKGDPADAPEPLQYSSEWSIGTPDLVVPLSRAYEIKATGFMPYQYDVVETSLTEDRWVSAYEVLPSERDVVHHVIIQVFEKGSTIRERAEGAGGYWAAYVPGNGEHRFPEGFAKKLPAGAKIQFQIHYTPSGKAKKERLKLGLIFADEPPQFEVKTIPLADRILNIPPGAEAHEEGMSRRVSFDLPLTSFMPHMHTRGAAFRYEVTYPDGKEEVLLDIPRYDFNWQLRYDLKKPKWIPKGSTLKVTGVFDNSSNNRANPDPTKRVKWGSQTVDEMLIGYIEYFVPVKESSVAAR